MYLHRCTAKNINLWSKLKLGRKLSFTLYKETFTRKQFLYLILNHKRVDVIPESALTTTIDHHPKTKMVHTKCSRTGTSLFFESGWPELFFPSTAQNSKFCTIFIGVKLFYFYSIIDRIVRGKKSVITVIKNFKKSFCCTFIIKFSGLNNVQNPAHVQDPAQSGHFAFEWREDKSWQHHLLHIKHSKYKEDHLRCIFSYPRFFAKCFLHFS